MDALKNDRRDALIQVLSNRSRSACRRFASMLVLAIGIPASGAEGETFGITEAEAEVEYDRGAGACRAQYDAAKKWIYTYVPGRPGGGRSEEQRAAFSMAIAEERACMAKVEEPRWDIPERLKTRQGEPEPTRRHRPAPCASCLDEREALDVAQAFLDAFEGGKPARRQRETTFKPEAHLAEVVKNFPWRGSDQAPWRRVGSVWHFGYAYGVRYSGRLDTQDPVADLTWRVWYQTGWIMPDEIAYAVERGFLPEEALDWGRQKRSEILLVHAKTGRVMLPYLGRDRWEGASSGWSRNSNETRPSRDIRNWANLRAYETAKEIAFRRAKLWLPESADPLLNYHPAPLRDVDPEPPDDEDDEDSGQQRVEHQPRGLPARHRPAHHPPTATVLHHRKVAWTLARVDPRRVTEPHAVRSVRSEVPSNQAPAPKGVHA